MTQAVVSGVQGAALPRIHHFATVTSALDVACDLTEKGMLDEWDSVLVQSQTEGRGQMRRVWVSPPGNLYAALRLPRMEPFDSAPAAVAMGALLASALSGFGCKIRLKWPNDLVLPRGRRFAKLGGILLEEKHGHIWAGIGINMLYAPEKPGEGVTAASLSQACSGELPGPNGLWQALVKHIWSVYKNGAFFSNSWKDFADGLLIWLGEHVEINDGGESASGVFIGLNAAGGAMLDDRGRLIEKFSGSMHPLDLGASRKNV